MSKPLEVKVLVFCAGCRDEETETVPFRYSRISNKLMCTPCLVTEAVSTN